MVRAIYSILMISPSMPKDAPCSAMPMVVSAATTYLTASHRRRTVRLPGNRAAFDCQPQAGGLWPPAAPQILSAVRQGSPAGVLVSWLKPDNGGSPITLYKVYRGTSDRKSTRLNSSHGYISYA